jgi:urea transport system permease protein
MVIFCAVGGRLSLFGAVYGALLVNWAKTSLSESFPELWLLAMGGLFIAVVLAFPNGLAGLYDKVMQRFSRRKAASDAVDGAPDAPPAPSDVSAPAAAAHRQPAASAEDDDERLVLGGDRFIGKPAS